jgi:trypsin
MKGTIAVLAVFGAVAAAAPASAVIGGDPVAPETVPWFADLAGCGGTLVAPSRVVTAAHCVAHRSLSPNELGFVAVAGETHHTARFAMHPAWRHANGENVLDDVAIVELVEPVTTVPPAALGDTAPAQAIILGRGRSTVPGSGASEEETFSATLHGAPLRPIADRECAAKFRTHRGNGGERFNAARMLCATDVTAALR